MLKATFVRTTGERDRIYVTRSNETTVSWSYPSYGEGLPHDLVHWVVETSCGLRFGFWSRVDAGAAEALAGAGWWMEGATLQWRV